MKRYMSRKFLLTLAVVVGAIAIVMGQDPDQVAQVLSKLGGDVETLPLLAAAFESVLKGLAAIVGAVIVVLRYLKVEGELDVAALSNATSEVVKE